MIYRNIGELNNSQKTYDIIYADPPWRYTPAEKTRRVENHYPTMSDDEIVNMTIPSNKNSVLYLWATSGKLPLALDVMKQWGFTYKSSAVWNKETIGMGYWWRGQHEFILVGTKGKFSPPKQSDRISSVYTERKTKHSKKPLFYIDYLDKCFPNTSKLELFSRDPKSGWDSFGNEI